MWVSKREASLDFARRFNYQWMLRYGDCRCCWVKLFPGRFDRQAIELPKRPLLTVQLLQDLGMPPDIAIDGVQAGPGDTVLVMQGWALTGIARDSSKPMPAQMVIVGIVDRID